MSDAKIFILLGGLGTRLKEIVSDVPKPMAPIEGKPFLWYKIMQLKKRGFKRFVFCTGYLAHTISEYFGDGSKFGIKIEYSVEEKLLGTGGALRYANKFIDGPFFMCNGDTYLDFDPQLMIESVKKKHAKYVMLLTDPEIKGEYGVVTINSQNQITDFIEKPSKDVGSRLINAGVYYLHPDIMQFIQPNEKVSIEKDIFTKMIHSDHAPLYGVEYRGYFIDIGIPHNYLQFCNDIKKKIINFD